MTRFLVETWGFPIPNNNISTSDLSPIFFLPCLQGVLLAAGVLAAPAGPPLRHLPRHPLQLRGRPDRHDGRGPRRLRRTLLLPHLRRRGQDRQDGGRPALQGGCQVAPLKVGERTWMGLFPQIFHMANLS